MNSSLECVCLCYSIVFFFSFSFLPFSHLFLCHILVWISVERCSFRMLFFSFFLSANVCSYAYTIYQTLVNIRHYKF